jgi:hypothetical protein
MDGRASEHPPILPQSEFSNPPESHYIAQQAYEPYDVYFGRDGILHTLEESEYFTSGQLETSQFFGLKSTDVLDDASNELNLALNPTLHTQLSQGEQSTTSLFDPSPLFDIEEDYDLESASNDQILPTNSMGPPTQLRKRKAPTLRAADWEPYKARIIELHITQRLPLKEVRQRIQEESGFTAEYVSFLRPTEAGS